MRRVADLRIDLVAALVLHAQRQPRGACRQGVRHGGVDAVVINLDVAQVFVVMLFAVGELRFTQRDAWAGLELHAATVEVIVLGQRPVQLQHARRGRVAAELVGLGDRQQVGRALRKHRRGGDEQAQTEQRVYQRTNGLTAGKQRSHHDSSKRGLWGQATWHYVL
jgi:hypothetical protein